MRKMEMPLQGMTIGPDVTGSKIRPGRLRHTPSALALRLCDQRFNPQRSGDEESSRRALGFQVIGLVRCTKLCQSLADAAAATCAAGCLRLTVQGDRTAHAFGRHIGCDTVL